jgi:hypothetical protein
VHTVVDLPSASRHKVDVRRPSSNADQSPETGFKVCDSIRQEERGHGAKHFFLKVDGERRSAEPLQYCIF